MGSAMTERGCREVGGHAFPRFRQLDVLLVTARQSPTCLRADPSFRIDTARMAFVGTGLQAHKRNEPLRRAYRGGKMMAASLPRLGQCIIGQHMKKQKYVALLSHGLEYGSRRSGPDCKSL